MSPRSISQVDASSERTATGLPIEVPWVSISSVVWLVWLTDCANFVKRAAKEKRQQAPQWFKESKTKRGIPCSTKT